MKSTTLSSFANPVRLKLIGCLSKGEKNVTQLIGSCGLSQSAVSQHLQKLRNAGLVSAERKGKKVYYRLLYPKAAKLAENLEKFITEIKHL